MKHYRHGDISFHPVKKASGEIIKHNGSFVVAQGEATGHHHRLKVADPSDLVIRRDEHGNMYFELLAPGSLVHEEHGTIELAPGTYRQEQEREKDWFALRVHRVVD
jgi:hypothetical protein